MSKMRIDKFLANMGVGSRSEIKRHAKAGLIKINGIIEKDAGKIIETDSDKVYFNEEEITYTKYIYLMMNKPSGVISATFDKFDDTVIDLLEEEYQHFDAFPVGRLDKDTEGLLLITNDGQLAHNLLSPKKHVDKEYYAQVQGKVTESEIKKFAKGLKLHEYTALPAKLELKEYEAQNNQSICHVTIQEGKFHQVKNMFAAVEMQVTYLKRIRMGSLHLDETLAFGEYRELSEEELAGLKAV